jgi:hypothetical protein
MMSVDDDSFEDVLQREQSHSASAKGDIAEVTRLLNEGHAMNAL